MRAALYARFSSDLQNVASIADQLTACRAFAGRLGATVAAEFQDAAVSGASTHNRPGLAALMAGARGGAFDVVIAEALDRLTRSGGDTWDIYEDLRAVGVAIHTIAEGEVQTLHVGLKGTMNALFLEELARKTRRGQAGVARSGRHAGGAPAYGYRRLRRLDAAGDPIPGLLEIDPEQAEVVRSVFRDYAAGASPRAIAARLNAQGLPGPRGGPWNASTINGNAARGNGLLHNRLYEGVRVWGRHTWSKDRRTGKRRARAAGAADQVTTEAPELRIVPAELWAAVQARYADVQRASAGGHQTGDDHPRPERARRPRRLLSGLMRCGACGGPMTAGGPDGRFLCSTRRERGPSACANGRSARAVDVERRVMAAIHDELLHPDVIAEAVRAYQEQYNQLAAAKAADRGKLERELGECVRRAERLVDQIADGLIAGPAVNDRLRSLEARRAELEAEISALADTGNSVVRLHPGTAGKYRQLIEQLRNATRTLDPAADMASADEAQIRANENARAALRALVTGVVVYPLPERGQYRLELEGHLDPLITGDEGVRITMGAGARSQRCPKLPFRVAA